MPRIGGPKKLAVGVVTMIVFLYSILLVVGFTNLYVTSIYVVAGIIIDNKFRGNKNVGNNSKKRERRFVPRITENTITGRKARKPSRGYVRNKLSSIYGLCAAIRKSID